MTRQETPDLLESMFKAGPEAKKPGKKQTPSRTPAKRPIPKAVVVEQIGEPPIRCTHYLSRDTASRLTIAQGQLLMLTALQKRNVSNSNVVEAALRLAFADLEENGENSQLVTILRQMAHE